MKCFYIKFHDHSSANGWLDDREVNTKPESVEAVGWLLKKTKRLLILVSFVDENGGSGTRQYILRSTIVKKKRIKL